MNEELFFFRLFYLCYLSVWFVKQINLTVWWTVWRRSRWQCSKKEMSNGFAWIFRSEDRIYQKLARRAENHKFLIEDVINVWNEIGWLYDLFCWNICRRISLNKFSLREKNSNVCSSGSGEKPPKTVIRKQVPPIIWNHSCCLFWTAECYSNVNQKPKWMFQTLILIVFFLKRDCMIASGIMNLKFFVLLSCICDCARRNTTYLKEVSNKIVDVLVNKQIFLWKSPGP